MTEIMVMSPAAKALDERTQKLINEVISLLSNSKNPKITSYSFDPGNTYSNERESASIDLGRNYSIDIRIEKKKGGDL